jgi:hypothetical protein
MIEPATPPDYAETCEVMRLAGQSQTEIERASLAYRPPIARWLR